MENQTLNLKLLGYPTCKCLMLFIEFMNLVKSKKKWEHQPHTNICWFTVVPIPFQSDDASNPDRLFDLIAVVIHCGSGPNRGHYISIVKSHGFWLLFDDDIVDVRIFYFRLPSPSPLFTSPPPSQTEVTSIQWWHGWCKFYLPPPCPPLTLPSQTLVIQSMPLRENLELHKSTILIAGYNASQVVFLFLVTWAYGEKNRK